MESNVMQEDDLILMENGDSYFELKQTKTVTTTQPIMNNSSKFSNPKGPRGPGTGQNWESQNRSGGFHQQFNGRNFNKENNRSRSRSQGRDQSDNNRRNFVPRNNNGRFESRPQRQDGFNYSSNNQRFNQGQGQSHGHGHGQRNNFQNNHNHYQNQNQRFNQNNRNEGRIYKPTLEGPLKSFRQFMESQRHEIDSNEAQKVYQQYVKEYEEKQDKILFAEHKNDEWFKEKYDRVLAERLQDEKREEARINAERFLINLRNGVYDGLNLDYEEYEHKHLFHENQSMTEEEKEAQDANGFTEIGIDNDHDIKDEPFYGFNTGSQTLFIKAFPKFISRWDLTECFRKLNGYLSLSMSEPLMGQNFNRLGWILFDNEENCNIAYEHLKTLNIKGHAFLIIKARNQQKTLKVCENVNEEAISTHVQLSKKLIETLDDEKDIKTSELVGYDFEVDPAKQLDLQTLYLRKVHSYCFYCAAEYIDERTLASKCGPVHLRRQKLGKETPRPDLPDLHQKIVELTKYRIQESEGKSRQSREEIEKDIENELDQEIKNTCHTLSKQGNWPCKFCTKIFKEDHFVVKHVRTKHPEQCEKLKEKKIYERFSTDKNKISSMFLASNGNHSQRDNSRPHGQQGFRPQYNNQRQDRAREYRDLDDPKVSQVRTSRPVINYGDL